jgi:hypothetical protein
MAPSARTVDSTVAYGFLCRSCSPLLRRRSWLDASGSRWDALWNHLHAQFLCLALQGFDLAFVLLEFFGFATVAAVGFAAGDQAVK